MQAKRRITRGGVALLALVLLGAATSVGVALGGARYLPRALQGPVKGVLDPDSSAYGVIFERPWVRTCTYELLPNFAPLLARQRSDGTFPPSVVRPSAPRWPVQELPHAPPGCRLGDIYAMLRRPPRALPEFVSVVEAGWPATCFRGTSRQDPLSLWRTGTERAWLIPPKE